MLTAALTRLAGSLDGLPLLSTRGCPGVFAGNAAGKEAARFCQENSLLRLLPQTRNGREVFLLSAQGREWLASQTCPRATLEELTHAFQERARDLNEMKGQLEIQEHALRDLTDFLGAVAAKLNEKGPPDPNCPLPGEAEILAKLQDWHQGCPIGDLPLPELYRALLEHLPTLTPGQFQDACRRLRERGRIYLHPWTGPLYELPEPSLAFMTGHEVAYYASLNDKTDAASVGYFTAESPS